MVSEGMIPDKSPETASRLIDNEAVIIVIKENEVNVLNEVGSRVWDLIDGKKDVKQIASVISDEFNVSFDEAIKDTEMFIDELSRKNMVILR